MHDMKRRKIITEGFKGISILGVASCSNSKAILTDKNFTSERDKLKGKVQHSVCKWCYKMPLEELAEAAQEIGMKSIELLDPAEWAVVKKYGLTCAISNGANLGIPHGFNNPKNHEELIRQYKSLIPQAADQGIKQIICFSGNKDGMSYEDGLENCAQGLEPLMTLAEQHDVKIVMELLNSKIDHHDYMCDHTAWGAQLVEKLGSSQFSLLYDIYHMQIMEGDVIRTIRNNHQYISHYHTGGVPGRNEIDHSQELYYPAIVQAIYDTGYEGYVSQEFIPKGPVPLESLQQGVMICDV